ncbi:hypothetical protein ACTFIV_004961 [Dictyostelium citrinum]
MSKTIKGIIFDLDDTLYDQLLPFKLSINKIQFLSEKIINMEEAFKQFRYHSDQVFEKTVNGEMSITEMHNYRFIKMLLDQGIVIKKEEKEEKEEKKEKEEYFLIDNDDNKKLTNEFQLNYLKELKQIKLINEFEQLLLKLNEIQKENHDIKIGIITNGPTEHQLEKFKSLKVFKYIKPEYSIISGSIGIEKPNPEIFKYLANKFEIPCDQCIYIGDSFSNDIISSSNAGMKSVWFNHRNRKIPLNSTIKPTFEINTPSEIINIILNLL